MVGTSRCRLRRVGRSIGSIEDGTVRSGLVEAVAEHAAAGGAFDALAVDADRRPGAGLSSNRGLEEVDEAGFSSMRPGCRCRGPFDPRMSGRCSLTCPGRHSSCRNEWRNGRSAGSVRSFNENESCRWPGLDGHAGHGSFGPRTNTRLGGYYQDRVSKGTSSCTWVFAEHERTPTVPVIGKMPSAASTIARDRRFSILRFITSDRKIRHLSCAR